jgi:hypothetical protein
MATKRIRERKKEMRMEMRTRITATDGVHLKTPGRGAARVRAQVRCL